jgi:translation initiation factor IF-3
VRGLFRRGEQKGTGGHISTELRINERIRVPEVRLVGAAGEQIGIVSITEALRLAQEADLDLVEVAPTARPPVCKLMDYGKFKYESALKARESRKNQAQTVIKEIKIRPKIDPHDYGTKRGHVERFLRQGDKVKVTIMFRGREQSRPELGYRLLQQLAGDVEELGFVESQPKQDGRNMIMVIGPHRKKSEARAATRAGEQRAEQHQRARAGATTQDAGSDTTAPPPSAPRSAAPQPVAPQPSAPTPTAPQPVAPQPVAPRSTAPPPAAPRPAAPPPAAPRPAAPPPAAPRPAAPRPAAPRPAAPRPAAPRPAATPAEAPAADAADGSSTPVSTAAQAAPRAAAPKPAPPRSAPPRSAPPGRGGS